MPSPPSVFLSTAKLFLAGFATSVAYTRETLFILTASEKARIRVLQTAVVNIPLILLAWYWVPAVQGLAGVLSRLFSGRREELETTEDLAYKATVDGRVDALITCLGLVPYFLVATVVSTIWAGDIASEAIDVTKRHASSNSSKKRGAAGAAGAEMEGTSSVGPLQGIAEALYRTVLVILLNITAVLLDVLFPSFIGKPAAIVLTAIVVSIVAHDPLWSLQGVSKLRCFQAVEQHWPYHLGFGLIAALATFFSGAIVNGSAYSLILPWLYCAALLHPPEKAITRWDDASGALLEADVGFPFLTPLQHAATALFAWLHRRFTVKTVPSETISSQPKSQRKTS